MESGQITAVVLASLICGTITVGVVAQAWLVGRGGGRRGGTGSISGRLDALEDRLYRMEQAIDAVAIEVERSAEAQRFTAKLLAQRLEVLPSAAVELSARES